MSQRNGRQQFTIRKKIFTLLGSKFHIYNETGGLVGFSQQKAFRLREDLRIYTDESKSRELVSIIARSIIDFGAAYDVTDSATGIKLGALRRKGISSLVRDAWIVLDAADQPIGSITEDSMAMAMARRFLPLGNLVPQTYHLTGDNGTTMAEYRTHFNPFVHRMTVSVSPECPVSPHVILAAGVLLIAIEGRQQN
jgi:hypothetical protein